MRNLKYLIITLLFVACIVCPFLASCQNYPKVPKASFYHDKYEGRPTKCSGVIFHQKDMVGASNYYSCGTWLKVTNPLNGKSVKIKIIDTGKLKTCLVDLSRSAFEKISLTHFGIIKVRVEICQEY